MQALPLGHHEQARDLSTRWAEPPTARFNLAVIVIAAVNVAAALTMITFILFDARILARSLRVQRVFHVHPAETLVLPFFAQSYMQKEAKQSARLAGIAVNLLGIVNLLLHIFLRSNAARAAIRPWKSRPSKKRPLRVFGPSDLEMTMLITSPVLLEEEAERPHVNDNQKLVDRQREPSHPANNTDPIGSEVGLIPQHPHPSMSSNRLRRPPQDENDHPQIVVQPSPFPQRKNSNYSIFPTFRSAMLRNSTSTTFSQGSEEPSLQPPRSIFTQPSNHSRDPSQQTSATLVSLVNDHNHKQQQHPSTAIVRQDDALQRIFPARQPAQRYPSHACTKHDFNLGG
ncbi:MAG: hypothetical protein Q9212_005887 [Teloschistes hypoglaucus]